MRFAMSCHESLAARSLQAFRLFSSRSILLNSAPAQASHTENHTYRARNAKRFLQTNHLQRTLGNSGPERWSFGFNQEKKSAPFKKPALTPLKPFHQESKESTIQTAASPNASKWSTYSMPSKESLAKQQDQAKRQEQEIEKQLASEPKPVKKQKRRLRPRKALISLTPNAVDHLKLLLNQPEPKLIRVGVKNRGCSGLTYDLEYITAPGKFDEVVEQDGVRVILDSKALFSIVGSEMDWIDDRLSSRFVFKNPNSKGTCGCGESFMV